MNPAFESCMAVLFGTRIVTRQFIIYRMYVRSPQIFCDIDLIKGKLKISDHKLDTLILKVVEFKRTGP
jgi:hypothetical protein